MPFQVFRRHQRKMMAALALFAMVAFTLDFSLIQRGFGPAAENPVVVKLANETVRRSDLTALLAERSRANRFMQLVSGQQDAFGGLDTRSLVDGLILQREADRLGIPVDRDLAVRWLRQSTDNQINTALFDRIYRQSFAPEGITDTQLLEAIANQLRLAEVRSLPGVPPVTPLDLYDAYRDQNERVSASAVAFRAEDYLKDVPEPTDAQVQAYFAKYAGQTPDRNRDTPGFKVPRKIRVEFVTADADAIARRIEAKLSDAELRKAFAERATEFPAPPPELPTNLFAGDPEAKLTPRLTDPFTLVRDAIARTVAREQAQAEVADQFGRLRDTAIAPFSETYGAALDRNAEAKEGVGTATPLPAPGDLLKTAAAAANLPFERTPPLDRELAASYGQIGAARAGGDLFGGGTTFADELFATKRGLYEEFELTDDLSGRRFLVWKIADEAERVPKLDEVRGEVVAALKLESARALAEKAAAAYAESARKAGGNLAAAGGDRTVIVTSAVPKLQPGAMLNPFQPEPARPSEILQIPDASPALREALFGLEPGKVAVAPNLSKSTYYVLALNQRSTADLAGLFSPFGARASLEQDVYRDAILRRGRTWMQELQKRAGLPADWVPPEEQREQAAEES
jgi:peptidyl-prolyl cis-trans isomerase D